MVGLRYLAKGSFLSEVGDLHGISKSSASLAVGSFVDAVNSNLDNIKFPTETNAIKLGFYRKCRIPNVIGAIDGTLIPIQAPKQNEAAFVCRKGFHAINCQAVVDHEMRFVDLVARWPGSQHDAFIFDNCALKEYLEESDPGFLLGDSGYPLRRYLLTPVLNPSSEAEEAYNRHHINGRIVIEKAFGVLKSRFRCLHKSGGALLFKPGKCCKVVEACVRLHNLCKDRRIPDPDLLNLDNDDQFPCIDNNDMSGRARQRDIIRNFEN